MISTNEFKTGVTINYEGNIYQVLEFQHVKPGKGAAFVRSKLKNLRTGAVVDITFNSGIKIPKAQIDKVYMQYLYNTGTHFVFMNNDTYDQIEIPLNQVEREKDYLVEGMSVEIMFFNHQEILGVLLPDKVVLEIIETVPGVRGDTKTHALKDAVLETGLLVKVPLFLEQNEKVIISTYDGSYVSRAK